MLDRIWGLSVNDCILLDNIESDKP